MPKAMICVLDKNGNEIQSKRIEVMFNPADYATSVNVTWGEKNGSLPEFKGTNFDKFTITLLFDTYEKKVDVREDHTDDAGKIIRGTKSLAELTFPSEAGRNSKNPPMCLFSWGKFNFKGYVEKVDQKFTLFLPDGIPVRSTVTVTMKPAVTAQEMIKLKGIEACRKIRTIKEGDRLDLIAAEELKNPLLWRRIAEVNEIADPFRFPRKEDIGRILIIPD